MIKQNERLGWCLRPNLKNLSRGFNLRRVSNMVGSTKIVFNCKIVKIVFNQGLADLRRGSNSLNLDTVRLKN